MALLPLLVCLLGPVLIELPTGFPSAPSLVSQTHVARDPQDPKTVTVIGRGIGLDLESAQKDALKSAVEKAVGLLLDAETILENDEIVERILTYSGAYIEKYETLETKQEDSGLWRVKVKAEVKKTQLEEKLVEEKLIKKKVDGKSLFAKARSKLNEKNSSALVFRKAFEGFPLGVVKASVVGEPEIVSEGENSVKFGVTVRMELDVEAWESWVARLDGLLGPIARQKGTWRPANRDVDDFIKKATTPDRVIFRQSKFWSPQLPKKGSKESFEKVGLPWRDDTFLFLIAKRPGAGQEWLWYSLARDPLLFEVARVWPTHTALTVSVVDAGGKPIVGETFSSSMHRGLVKWRGESMQATPFGAINFRGTLWSFCSGGLGDMYSDWIVSNLVQPGVFTSESPISLDDNGGGNGDSRTSYLAAVVCPAGFFANTNSIMTDSYALPLLIDVPLSALESADNVEVRLSEERAWKTKTISLEAKWRDPSTKKTVDWKVPEKGSK
jgi:hypothetical protein